jgi:AcrR family transcriptional regulator
VTPRQRLTRELVVETAEALVDLRGWNQLTMTALATKLGVRGPSLYSHVENVETLLADVQVRALSALSARLQRAAMGKVADSCMRFLSDELRAYATEHPGLYDLAMSEAIDGDRMQMAGEPAAAALTAAIESFGIADPPLETLLTCFATLHGVIVLDRTRLFRGVAEIGDLYDQATDLVILWLKTQGDHRAPTRRARRRRPS